MPAEASTLELTYKTALLVGGLGCFVHFIFFSGQPKKIDPEQSVPGWQIGILPFFIGGITIVGGVVIVQLLAAQMAPAEWLAPGTPTQIVVFGLATHLAALGALFLLYRNYRDHFQDPFSQRSLGWPKAFVIALYSFLALLPVLYPLTFAWSYLLEAMGVEPQPQDAVLIFAQVDSLHLLLLMIFLTVVVAPVSEEILFRGCLYRFIKAKTSIIAALVSTNLLFAFLHYNLLSFLPLLLLGIILAYVYEKSGDLKVPILLHGIFNLNTVVFILISNDIGIYS